MLSRFISVMSLVSMVLAGNIANAKQDDKSLRLFIEVFIANDYPVAGKETLSSARGDRELELHLYEIDGIQRIELKLSENLPSDLQQSKQVVLQRIQRLSKQSHRHMQRSAMGMTRAIQYGIDRYPAIVFDGQAVVYGVSDLTAALDHYRKWRAEMQP